MLRPLPPSVPVTRDGLHRVAAHVLARRRQAYTGLIGLRPSPGGVATPAFGDDVEVVRTSGAFLVVERAGVTNRVALRSLAEAADLAGVDLGVEFSVGEVTPETGDAHASLDIDDLAARALGEWWSLGLQVLDELVATEPSITASEAPQLWPEHFDLASVVTVAGDGGQDRGWKLNLGASAGDSFEELPYLYVGPWAGDRPGDPAYWNAPFGAVLRHAELADLPAVEQRAAAVAFLRAGVRRFVPG